MWRGGWDVRVARLLSKKTWAWVWAREGSGGIAIAYWLRSQAQEPKRWVWGLRVVAIVCRGWPWDLGLREWMKTLKIENGIKVSEQD